MADDKPIIIIKKKGGHGGHHGGAWKVAYADFVTAMMALFIVLWLMNSSKQVQEAVGGYFKDPTGTVKNGGSNMQGSGESFTLTRDDMPKLKDELQKSVRRIADFDKLKDHIEMTVTAEGLRIELMESESGTFFESGNPVPTAQGKEFLIALARELGRLPNKISIEGHTDAKPFARGGNYGNWELSTDRANVARRLMAGQRDGSGPGDASARIRGSTVAQGRQSGRPLEPEDHGDRAIYAEGRGRCKKRGIRG
jgi:chemotaxis protein MotB